MTPEPQPAVTVETLVIEFLRAAKRLGVLSAEFQPVGGCEGHDGCNRRDQHADDGRNDNTRRHFVCFVLSWGRDQLEKRSVQNKTKTETLRDQVPSLQLPCYRHTPGGKCSTARPLRQQNDPCSDAQANG